MELSSYSISELVNLYSSVIKELKSRGILRTKNVVGELGEYIVLEYYNKSPKLPVLSIVPLGTKNINAIGQDGERYSIKSTTNNVTGVIYGLEPKGSKKEDKPLFEYIIICKLDNDFDLEGIYQLSWEVFQKHKKWHSRMSAWNIALTKAVKEDALIVYEKNMHNKIYGDVTTVSEQKPDDVDEADVETVPAIVWNKTAKVDHKTIRSEVAERLQKIIGGSLEKTSPSRYVSSDRETALFVLSATFSQKNNEYWYSINDENIPWLKLFPTCFIAFALGGSDHVLVFPFDRLEELLKGCLKTKEDPSISKKAHYHLSFAVEGSHVYFKQKIPEKDYIEVSDYLK